MFVPSSPKRATASNGGETKKAFLHVNHASKPELISSLRPSGERRRRQFTITGSASGVRLIAGGTTTALSRKKKEAINFQKGGRGLLQKRNFLLCYIRGIKRSSAGTAPPRIRRVSNEKKTPWS